MKIVGLIVACEIAFWVVLAAGLTVRYVLRRPQLGKALLIAVPVVDVVLLLLTWLDLRRGGDPTPAHGLAAVYIGVSVAFGRELIRWADARWAHWFAGGPPPTRSARYGLERARRERRLWLKHLLAWTIGVCLLGLGTIVIRSGGTAGDGAVVLWRIAELWTLILGIDFVISISYTLAPKRVPR